MSPEPVAATTATAGVRDAARIRRPRALALRPWLGAVLISLSGVWVRLAAVEPARSAFVRNLYALPVLALLLWWARRRSGGVAAAEAGGWSRAVVPLAVVAGAFLGLDLFAYHVAIDAIGAGLATLLANLQIVFVGLAGVVVFAERPRRGFWLALPLVLVGVSLIAAVGRPLDAGASVASGVAAGVAGGVLYAAFLVVLRFARLRRTATATVPMLLSATLGAALVLGLLATVQGVAGPPAGWEANAWLVVLALGSQVAGWLLLTSSIHHLPATLTSIALLLQPVLAMVWGAVLLAEPIGWPQAAGAGAVLAGVALAHRAVTRPQPVAGVT